jgi:hypothetical protein
MSSLTPQEMRAYRARRKAAGNPCKRTVHPLAAHDRFIRRERAYIGWCGEGFTDATTGKHTYAILCSSRGDYLENVEGITTQQAFEFMLLRPNGIHAFFGGGYDVSKIFESMSSHPCGIMPRNKDATGRDVMRYILENETGFPIWITLGDRTYAVEWMPGKLLSLKRFRNARKRFAINSKGVNAADYDATIQFWDMKNFTRGMSFADALATYEVPFDRDYIEMMEKLRPVFSLHDMPAMKEYCTTKAQLIALLHAGIARSLNRADIRPTSWFGVGSCAAVLLKRYGVKAHYVKDEPDMQDVFARGFLGGRAELTRVGRTGAIVSHDMCSAYAWAVGGLPSLHGSWEHNEGAPGSVCIGRVRYAFPAGLPFYPLPYRDARPNVFFPRTGEGWYWHTEVAAARAFLARFGGELEVLDSWRFTPDDPDARPFAFVGDLYAARLARQVRGDASEKLLKLSLAAIYGKTAQKRGRKAGETGAYYSLAWAGMVTAAIRARVLEAALTAPESVVSFAVDCVYADRVLPLPPGEGLGDWRVGQYTDSVCAQAGVFWLQDEDGEWTAKTSGFERTLTAHPSIALREWEAGHDRVTIDTSRFISMQSALANNDLWTARGTRRSHPRVLNLSGASVMRVGLPLGFAALARGSAALVPRENVWYESSEREDCSFPYDPEADAYRIDGVRSKIFTGEIGL